MKCLERLYSLSFGIKVIQFKHKMESLSFGLLNSRYVLQAMLILANNKYYK